VNRTVLAVVFAVLAVAAVIAAIIFNTKANDAWHRTEAAVAGRAQAEKLAAQAEAALKAAKE
jgi:Tfp pilus assembly protein PilV